MGFDLVTFSGGKGIRGPQSAGLLLGRKPLIAAARLNAPPNGDTIGRGMKVNKEEMLGMLVALELFLEKDHAGGAARVRQARRGDPESGGRRPGRTRPRSSCPRSRTTCRTSAISWDAADEGRDGGRVVKALRDGEPSIASARRGKRLVVGVWMMRPGEEKVVAQRLREVLEKQGLTHATRRVVRRCAV